MYNVLASIFRFGWAVSIKLSCFLLDTLFSFLVFVARLCSRLPLKHHFKSLFLYRILFANALFLHTAFHSLNIHVYYFIHESLWVFFVLFFYTTALICFLKQMHNAPHKVFLLLFSIAFVRLFF